MKIKNIAIFAVLMSIMCVCLVQMATASDLIVVATKDTYEASQKWVDFLTLNEVPVKHVTPREFDKYKKEPYVVLMGGMDEPDGIKVLAKEILAEDELEYVLQKGNGEIYFKFKVFDPMQTIIVFAGSDRAAAAAARKKNKSYWLDSFIQWFDLDMEQEGKFHVY
jgi:hypothetical protein